MIAHKILPETEEMNLVPSWSKEKKAQFIEERFEEYIAFLKRSRRPENTTRGFEYTYKHVKLFHTGGTIRNYDLQERFWDDYVAFLLNDMNYTNNSCRVHIERFRTVLNYFHFKHKHNLSKTFFTKEASHTIKDEILSDEEIEMIWNCNPPTPGLKALRDKFLVSLYTGCRMSAINSVFISRDNSSGHKMVGFYEQKDNEPRYIALHPRLEPVIESARYKTTTMLPLMFSHFKKLIDFKGEGLKMVRKGSQTKRTMISRNEIVTFHSARKTFAVRMLEAGMDIYALSKILGHSEIKTTMKFYSLIRDNKLNDQTINTFKNIK